MTATHKTTGTRKQSGSAHRIAAPEIGERVILAIDTAIGTSVALGAGGEIVECSSEDPRGHAEVIGTLMSEVFAEAGVSPTQVTHVTAGMGPGPFTGLRVGIAAAHAFAAGRGLTLLPLVSHDAAALELLEAGATSEVRVVQDAKRRELFVTEYASLDWAGVPVRTRSSFLVPREGYEEAPNDAWPAAISAARLVQVAARKLTAGSDFEPDQALYLRQPDVKLPGAPKAVSQPSAGQPSAWQSSAVHP